MYLYRKNKLLGFTIIEVMVAMIVLAIGLLGMAGITLMVIKGGKDASFMQDATHLASGKIEGLKDLLWADLGTAAICLQTDADAKTKGCTAQNILIESGLNESGLTQTELGTPPFPFIRKTVVCINGVTLNQTAPSTDINDPNWRCYAGDNPQTHVPPELTCNPNDPAYPPVNSTEVGTNEKKVKILVTWRDKYGRCHRVDMKTVLVNLM